MIFPILALTFAALESFALIRQRPRLEWLAKPAVILSLLAWLLTSAKLEGLALWFAVGLLFSLAGDLLLMFSLDRFFRPGLAAFLLAHIAYVIGFNSPLPEFSSWSLVAAVVISMGGARIIRRILDALAAKGQSSLRKPIIAYSMVISLMLLAAILKLTDPAWSSASSGLAAIGAFLFYISDIILAWNKFVSPIHNGRVYNIAVYHLGQILMIAGIMLQVKNLS